MKEQKLTFQFTVFESIEELNDADSELLRSAREATGTAYAPYSKFNVAASARLENGKIISGTNQENASYPVGICAERVLLSSISAVHPGVKIDSIAVTYQPVNGSSTVPASPCGLCRQTLLEYEQRQESTIRILLSGMEGEVYLLETVSDLLPLSFGKSNLE